MPAMAPLLHIRSGDAELVLAPEIGGGIAALRFGGVEVLRCASVQSLAAGDPLGLAEFPMAPFVNRVAANTFDWLGQRITMVPAHVSSDEALHGLAWHQSWLVLEAQRDAALLALDIAPSPAWPFACNVQRRFSLSASALRIDMALENRGAGPMPAALGFHPYFPAPGATIQAETKAAWLADARGIPKAHRAIRACEGLRAGAPVAKLALDHCFTGWDGAARLTWPSHCLRLRAWPNPGFLQIYTPWGADFFCVEPQTAMPDALNRPAALGGTRSLSAGESLSLCFEIHFEAAGL